MLLAFSLSMPNIGSWNGKWSGDGHNYVVVKSFTGKQKIEKAKEILKKGRYYYDFGDGWCACVSVQDVDSKTASKLRRKSDGFCGYDWMIKSIINTGVITPTVERQR